MVLERSASMMLTRAVEEQGSAPPDWADGLAYPKALTIYIHSGRPINETLSTYLHEVSHIALHQAVLGRPLPRWFKEGMAILQSEPFDAERIWVFSQAAAMSQVLDLQQLAIGFPQGGHRAGIAYAQSLHFVGFLRRRLGGQGLSDLLSRVRQGIPFEAALGQAAGVDLQVLEDEWRTSLSMEWGWVAVVLSADALWGLGALLLVVAYVRKRLEIRAGMQRLRDQDAADDMSTIKGRDAAADLARASNIDAEG